MKNFEMNNKEFGTVVHTGLEVTCFRSLVPPAALAHKIVRHEARLLGTGTDLEIHLCSAILVLRLTLQHDAPAAMRDLEAGTSTTLGDLLGKNCHPATQASTRHLDLEGWGYKLLVLATEFLLTNLPVDTQVSLLLVHLHGERCHAEGCRYVALLLSKSMGQRESGRKIDFKSKW